MGVGNVYNRVEWLIVGGDVIKEILLMFLNDKLDVRMNVFNDKEL